MSQMPNAGHVKNQKNTKIEADASDVADCVLFPQLRLRSSALTKGLTWAWQCWKFTASPQFQSQPSAFKPALKGRRAVPCVRRHEIEVKITLATVYMHNQL